MKSLYKKLIISYLIIIFIKMILVSLIPAPTAFSDEYIYFKAARNFFFEQSFDIPEGLGNNYPPLYPIIISLAYIFKDTQTIYLVAKLINVVISSLIIFPAFFLAREFITQKKAFLYAILISVIPSNFIFSQFILSENLFYPLFLTTIYFLYKHFTENKVRWSILAGVFLSLSFLTRAISIITFIVTAIVFVILYMQKKTSLRNNLLLFFASFFILFPWFLRNFHLYGLSIPKLILGGYSGEAIQPIQQGYPWLKFFVKSLLYTGHLILASGVVFTMYAVSIPFKKIKSHKTFFTMGIMAFILTSLFIFIGANHAVKNSAIPFLQSILPSRTIGRYIDTILPIIFLISFITAYNFKAEISKKKFLIITILTAGVLAFSSLLTLFSLFPPNNASLTHIGMIKYIVEYIVYSKTTTDLTLFWPVVIGFGVLFFLLPFITYLIIQKMKIDFSKLVILFLILSFSISILNFGVNHYNSKSFWYDTDQTKLGLWLNDYDHQISTVLIDKRDCGVKLFRKDQSILCDQWSSVVGFWLNDNLIVAEPVNLKQVNYVISKHKLDLPIINQKGDIYLYKAK